MARPRKNDDIFSSLIDRLAEAVASRLGSIGRGSGRPAAAASSNGRKTGRRSTAGRKLDMSCRVAGCPNKSKGPRFGFICEDHIKKLSKKDQQAARDAWKAKHAR